MDNRQKATANQQCEAQRTRLQTIACLVIAVSLTQKKLIGWHVLLIRANDIMYPAGAD